MSTTQHIPVYLLTVDAPMAKATMSVTEVTVTDTPACFIVMATCSGRESFCSPGVRFFQASTMTNISSTPIPIVEESHNGINYYKGTASKEDQISIQKHDRRPTFGSNFIRRDRSGKSIF